MDKLSKNKEMRKVFRGLSKAMGECLYEMEQKVANDESITTIDIQKMSKLRADIEKVFLELGGANQAGDK